MTPTHITMTVTWWDGKDDTQRETLTILRSAVLLVRPVHEEPHPRGASHRVEWSHDVDMYHSFLDAAEAARVAAALAQP